MNENRYNNGYTNKRYNKQEGHEDQTGYNSDYRGMDNNQGMQGGYNGVNNYNQMQGNGIQADRNQDMYSQMQMNGQMSEMTGMGYNQMQGDTGNQEDMYNTYDKMYEDKESKTLKPKAFALFLLLICGAALVGVLTWKALAEKPNNEVTVNEIQERTQYSVGMEDIDESKEVKNQAVEEVPVKNNIVEEQQNDGVQESSVVENKENVVNSTNNETADNNVGSVESEFVVVEEPEYSIEYSAPGVVMNKEVVLVGNENYTYKITIDFIPDGQENVIEGVYFCSRNTYRSLSNGQVVTVYYSYDRQGRISINVLEVG